MTAKEYLQRAYNMRRRISAKEIHLEELRTEAEHITADLSGMPRGSGASSPVERLAVQIADLTWELELDWLDLIQYQEEIRQTIEKIEDPLVVQVLSLRYLSYKTWREITDLMNYSASHIYRLQARGFSIIENMRLNESIHL